MEKNTFEEFYEKNWDAYRRHNHGIIMEEPSNSDLRMISKLAAIEYATVAIKADRANLRKQMVDQVDLKIIDSEPLPKLI